MSSKLVLKNKDNTELIISHNDGKNTLTLDTNQLEKVSFPVKDDEEFKQLTETPDVIWFTNGRYGNNVLVKTDEDLEDNGGTIRKTNIGTTYKLVYEGPVNVKWFGSKRDGSIFDTLDFTKNLCSFDMEQEPGKGNLQGAIIYDNFVYAFKNVKDNANNIRSYSPGETGKIIKFSLKTDGTELTKVDEFTIDKFGHQQLSYFTQNNKLFLVNSGGTKDDDVAIDIEEYSGYIHTDVYPNAGKQIAIYDVASKSNTLIRVAPDYSPDDLASKWYHSVPYTTPDGKTLVVVLSDIRYSPRKIIRLFDFEALRNGTIDYNGFYSEIAVELNDVIPTEYNAFQGVSLVGNSIFLQFGYYQPKHNKTILEYSMSGTLIKKHLFYPSFIQEDNYKVVELEGMCLYNGLIISSLNTKDNNNDYKEYLILHGFGKSKSLESVHYPATFGSQTAIDFMVKDGNTFRFQSWNETDETSELTLNITSYGNPQFKGSYLALKAKKDDLHAFKPLSYNIDTSDRQLLQIRGWKSSVDDGAGINLYGNNDSLVSGADIHFFGNDFKFKNQLSEDVFQITSAGNLRVGSYIGFDWDGSNYNKILNRNSSGTLEFRAKGTLSGGAGINMYDKDHSTLPFSIKLYANATNSGHIILDDLETSDPAIAGALWNDGGTLKISAG